ncbi:hypothetical protein L7F22_066460 [Adiantum nelumboides]|nr:hypothetical protein [Adiantum nelumboides]
MSMLDPYKVLGVRWEATGEEVKKAYRKIALQFHPDRHTQASKQQQEVAARRFREASEAYQVLSDPHKRAIYNRNGHRTTSASYGDWHSASSSSSSPPFNNQWHYQRYHYNASAYWHRRPRSHRLSLSPFDLTFHALFAGTLIIGLLYGGGIGDSIWNLKNRGKSYDDILRAKQRRDIEGREDDRKQ